jgi:hypothetical protein
VGAIGDCAWYRKRVSGGRSALSAANTNDSFELVINPRSDDYEPDDDRWRQQVATLYTELRPHVDVDRRGGPVEGTKGAIDEVIIAFGSSGAFTAMFECFRAWLRRDRNRRIDVRWDDNGVEHFVTLDGEAVDAESVRLIAKAAADRLGGRSWLAGTELS